MTQLNFTPDELINGKEIGIMLSQRKHMRLYHILIVENSIAGHK